jgi:hypothetical protein
MWVFSLNSFLRESQSRGEALGTKKDRLTGFGGGKFKKKISQIES